MPTITNCLFLDNVANKGGAIEAAFGERTLENCTFAGNTSMDGGAVYICNTYESQITSCTFVYNGAVRGGAITIETSNYSPATIANTIIAFSAEGEGLYWDGQGTLELLHNDIYGNSGGDWVGEIAGQFGLEGNVNLDPLFCDTASRDFTLATNSPCLPENNPGGVQIGAHGWGCDYPTNMVEWIPEQAERIQLGNHPNPFNPITTISFELPALRSVKLIIYTLNGKRVTTLLNEPMPAGHHEITWTGRDEFGHDVASGSYIYQIEAGEYSATKRMVLIR